MMHTMRLAALALAALVAAGPASALDLTKKRQNLPDLVLGNEEGNDFVVENREIELESARPTACASSPRAGRSTSSTPPSSSVTSGSTRS